MEKSSFRGFESIINSSYLQESRDCKLCENDCRYKIVTLSDGKKFYSEDVCERYSGAQKKKLGENLPDLFEEHEKMLFDSHMTEVKRKETIGIPRGLMFNDTFPFFNALFSSLGFEIKVSDKTNKKIVQLGLENVVGEPCYPIKVSHGHVADLIGKVDYTFTPMIVNMQDKEYPQSYTCPYIQAAPDLFNVAFGKNVKFLSPTLYFRRDFRQIKNAVSEMFSQNDIKIGKKELDNALHAAFSNQEEFYKKMKQRGKEILNSLQEIAFVVIGRPYAIYDSAMNMNIGKKIKDLGILAIPMDFLPIEDEKYSVKEEFTNLYARQAQKILSVAKLVKNDPRLRGVLIDYFACGPNAFINQFFKEEVNSND